MNHQNGKSIYVEDLYEEILATRRDCSHQESRPMNDQLNKYCAKYFLFGKLIFNFILYL